MYDAFTPNCATIHFNPKWKLIDIAFLISNFFKNKWLKG